STSQWFPVTRSGRQARVTSGPAMRRATSSWSRRSNGSAASWSVGAHSPRRYPTGRCRGLVPASAHGHSQPLDDVVAHALVVPWLVDRLHVPARVGRPAGELVLT